MCYVTMYMADRYAAVPVGSATNLLHPNVLEKKMGRDDDMAKGSHKMHTIKI